MSDQSNEPHAIIALELVAAVMAKFGAEIAKIRAECRAERSDTENVPYGHEVFSSVQLPRRYSCQI